MAISVTRRSTASSGTSGWRCRLSSNGRCPRKTRGYAEAVLAQSPDRGSCAPVMDEDAAGTFPEMTVLIPIINQCVTGTAMLALQSSRRGDHLGARKVPLGPAPLLRLGPVAAG